MNIQTQVANLHQGPSNRCACREVGARQESDPHVRKRDVIPGSRSVEVDGSSGFPSARKKLSPLRVNLS